jgi:D-3-phosphoglycerate dehydrogenase
MPHLRHPSTSYADYITILDMPIPTNTSKPKILIPEKVSPDGLALLKDLFEVDERKGLSPDELKGIIGDYEALIVRSETQVTAELLGAAKKLKVVARAGVGVDNVDVATATKHGIIVVNSPSGNINAAAEHTIAREFKFFCSAYFLFSTLRER